MGGVSRRATHAAILILMATVTASALYAQELSLDDIARMIDKGQEFALYRSDAENLLRPFHDLKADGLPSLPLVDILREGAVKHVPVAVLLRALDAAEARVRTASRILKNAHLWPEGLEPAAVKRRIELVRRVSLVLQGGVPELLVTSIIDARPRTEQGLRLAEALVGVLQVAAVSEPDLLVMSNTILTSRLPVASYQSLPGLFVRGRVAGLSPDDIARSITNVAARGGGIIQMDQQLRRLGGQQ